MFKKVLSNGITLVLDKRPTESLTIEATVKVGSNNENKDILGISHFIEHMLFEGTKTRDARQIAMEIESIGGEINALTSHERTSYHIKVLKKHFDKALEILADLIQNPKFNDEEIEKERKVILDEIHLINDNPQVYQWILFQKILFKKSPAKNPIYGSIEAIKKITKQDILDYYNKYYTTKNLILTIAGNVDIKIIKDIEEAFKNFNKKDVEKEPTIMEPPHKVVEIIKEKRDIFHSYIVLGFKAATRKDNDSYILDVIRTILGTGMSSRLFNEIRIKRGLAYNVGIQYESSVDFGFFSVYLSTDKKNIEEVKKIILDEFKKIQEVSDKELDDAQNYLEGQYIIELEDTHKRADILGFWELVGNAKLSDDYINNIKKVTKEDIKRVAKEYFHDNYCLIILEQKD